MKNIERENIETGTVFSTKLGVDCITVKQLKGILEYIPENAILTVREGTAIYNVQEIMLSKEGDEINFDYA